MTDSLQVDNLPDDLISLRDAARLAGDVHPTTIRRWIGQQMLTAYRRGPRLLYVSRGEVTALARPVQQGGTA
ncbi:DNA-binding protein [Nocardia sp. CS682]|uniref:DNA-binding protein n=1 Tax=Nocardia sp. CS682 TaxID=1047172 RepID=UPI0010756E50|nr:DNA-binding protein [Nocardia sp. CS682]